MKKPALLVLLVVVCGGCINAKVITREQYDQRLAAYAGNTIGPRVSYMGTHRNLHFINIDYRLSSIGTNDNVALPVDQLAIEDPMPLTTNRKKWRRIDYWRPFVVPGDPTLLLPEHGGDALPQFDPFMPPIQRQVIDPLPTPLPPLEPSPAPGQ
jgi:hypothetical protein